MRESSVLVVLMSAALAACEDRAAPTAAPTVVAPTTAASAAVTSAASSPSSSAAPTPTGPARLSMKPIALPGAAGALSLDYLAVDRARGRVWVPAADTGSVDVIDAATHEVTRIDGFATAEREGRAGKRKVGPSSVTIGDGVAYVGNRASSEVCAVTLDTLKKGACLKLDSAPDGLAYVATTKELWATTPKASSIVVLDASTPAKLVVKATIKLEGAPEGYAVDALSGVFFTNLEDKDKTLRIDARTRKVTATWDPHCGGDGPRGLAVRTGSAGGPSIDQRRRLLFVACTDQLKVLDVEKGTEIASLPIGAGIDNIDYVESKGELFVAAGGPATVSVLDVAPHGTLSVKAVGPTAPGVRVVVATADGNAFAADGKQGRILALTRAP